MNWLPQKFLEIVKYERSYRELLHALSVFLSFRPSKRTENYAGREKRQGRRKLRLFVSAIQDIEHFILFFFFVLLTFSSITGMCLDM